MEAKNYKSYREVISTLDKEQFDNVNKTTTPEKELNDLINEYSKVRNEEVKNAWGRLIGRKPKDEARNKRVSKKDQKVLDEKQKIHSFYTLESNEHVRWIHLATVTAKDNVAKGGLPFGSVLVSNDDDQFFIAGESSSQDNDPTAHSEMNVIRDACKKLQTTDLTGFILYTSCKPSQMSLGAIQHVNIDKVYYNADKHDVEMVNLSGKDLYDDDDSKVLQIEELRLDSAFEPFQEWFDKKEEKIKWK